MGRGGQWKFGGKWVGGDCWHMEDAEVLFDDVHREQAFKPAPPINMINVLNVTTVPCSSECVGEYFTFAYQEVIYFCIKIFKSIFVLKIFIGSASTHWKYSSKDLRHFECKLCLISSKWVTP